MHRPCRARPEWFSIRRAKNQSSKPVESADRKSVSVVGALDQPESAFVEHPEAAGTASRLTADQLASARAAVPGLVLLDVRGPGEREMGCIEDSVHIPLGQLRDRVGELDPARPVVTYCAGGYRSSIAASLLRASGFADVSDLVGGYQAWQAAA